MFQAEAKQSRAQRRVNKKSCFVWKRKFGNVKMINGIQIAYGLFYYLFLKEVQSMWCAVHGTRVYRVTLTAKIYTLCCEYVVCVWEEKYPAKSNLCTVYTVYIVANDVEMHSHPLMMFSCAMSRLQMKSYMRCTLSIEPRGMSNEQWATYEYIFFVCFWWKLPWRIHCNWK